MNIEGRPHKPQSWEHLLEKDPHSGTRFRLGIVAAVFIHAGIFAITWPTVAQAPPEEPDQIVIAHVLRNVVPRQPPPPMEFTVPNFPENASIIVPGPPEEVSTEPLVRDVPPIPIDVAGPVEFVLPPPPPPTPDPGPSTGYPMLMVKPPEVVYSIRPLYTEPARRAGVEGVVILELVIDTEGAVQSVKVLRGLPLGLTKSAVRAAEQWRFKPCFFNERPTSVRFVLTVSFNIAR
jgi:protein TonB